MLSLHTLAKCYKATRITINSNCRLIVCKPNHCYFQYSSNSFQYPPPPVNQRQCAIRILSNDSQNKVSDAYAEYISKSSKKPNTFEHGGILCSDIPENNPIDDKKPTTAAEDLSLGSVHLNPLEMKKMIPHGTATNIEVENAIADENLEWGNTHWSNRNYTAKHGEIIDRHRSSDIKRMIESSKPPLHKKGLRSMKPVVAGGKAYPTFYDPNENSGIERLHTMLPKTKEGKKARVIHIQSLHKITGLDYSKCSMEYDFAQGQYSIALEKLRASQVQKLVEITGHSEENCKKVFDKYLGDYDKTVKKLQLIIAGSD